MPKLIFSPDLSKWGYSWASRLWTFTVTSTVPASSPHWFFSVHSRKANAPCPVRELLSFFRLLLGASFLYSGNSPVGILLETVSLQYKCPRAKLTFPASAGHLGHAQDPGLINQMPPSPLWHDISTKPGSLDFLAVCELYIYRAWEKAPPYVGSAVGEKLSYDERFSTHLQATSRTQAKGKGLPLSSYLHSITFPFSWPRNPSPGLRFPLLIQPQDPFQMVFGIYVCNIAN